MCASAHVFTKIPAQRRAAQIGIAAGVAAREEVPNYSGAPSSANFIKHKSYYNLISKLDW